MQIVTVFGTSRPKPGDLQYESARALGVEPAQKGRVVCRGGYAGVRKRPCWAPENLAGGRSPSQQILFVSRQRS